MREHSVLVEQRGRTGSVFLDDVDISTAVCAVRADLSARDMPVIELSVLARVTTLKVDKAAVTLPEATRKLLLQLGWTPPT